MNSGPSESLGFQVSLPTMRALPRLGSKCWWLPQSLTGQAIPQVRCTIHVATQLTSGRAPSSHTNVPPLPSCQGSWGQAKPRECQYPHSQSTHLGVPYPCSLCVFRPGVNNRSLGAQREVEPICCHGLSSPQGGEKRGTETGCGKKTAGISEESKKKSQPQNQIQGP